MHEAKKETSVNYSFEKDEYNYLAALLIFGKRSPKVINFMAFSLDTFRRHKNLVLSEQGGLNPEGHLEIKRHLRIDDSRLFETSHTDMHSEVNQIITYVDSSYKFHISDAIFSDEDLQYYQEDWNATVENKIRTMGMLIKSLNERKIVDIPLLINEFPEVTKTLLDRSEFWLKR